MPVHSSNRGQRRKDSLRLSVCVSVALCLGELSALAIVQVATSKPSYYLGEDITVFVTVPVAANVCSSYLPQAYYTIDGSHPSTDVFLPVISCVTAPITWTNTHSWSHYTLSLGTHSVVGNVVNYGTSPPATFDIVQPPTPQGNFLIDFDTIPGTTAPVAHLVAYDASGVHFHTKQGAAVGLHDIEGNSWVEGFDAYPTGFHVIADFTMPVFGATAKVAGGTGVQITMIAKNAQGQTLATNVSAPVVNPGQFGQTLSVRATEPIASLEWWPSMPNSTAGVDDLLVITTPPLTASVVGNTLRVTWPTVAGASYQLWSSTDLKTWSPWGTLQPGNGDVLTNDCPMAGAALFFCLSKGN